MTLTARDLYYAIKVFSNSAGHKCGDAFSVSRTIESTYKNWIGRILLTTAAIERHRELHIAKNFTLGLKQSWNVLGTMPALIPDRG